MKKNEKANVKLMRKLKKRRKLVEKQMKGKCRGEKEDTENMETDEKTHEKKERSVTSRDQHSNTFYLESLLYSSRRGLQAKTVRKG